MSDLHDSFEKVWLKEVAAETEHFQFVCEKLAQISLKRTGCIPWKFIHTFAEDLSKINKEAIQAAFEELLISESTEPFCLFDIKEPARLYCEARNLSLVSPPRLSFAWWEPKQDSLIQ